MTDNEPPLTTVYSLIPTFNENIKFSYWWSAIKTVLKPLEADADNKKFLLINSLQIKFYALFCENFKETIESIIDLLECNLQTIPGFTGKQIVLND